MKIRNIFLAIVLIAILVINFGSYKANAFKWAWGTCQKRQMEKEGDVEVWKYSCGDHFGVGKCYDGKLYRNVVTFISETTGGEEECGV